MDLAIVPFIHYSTFTLIKLLIKISAFLASHPWHCDNLKESTVQVKNADIFNNK